MMTFAKVYRLAFDILMGSPLVEFSCRGLKIWKEMSPVNYCIEMKPFNKISVFSCPTHRVVPIKFVLAELCYILAGKGDVESLSYYNKSMMRYSEDGGKTISGSYGLRLQHQLEAMADRLTKDLYTRQSCAVIYEKADAISSITHMPCNIFLQFLCRHPFLDLHVLSRSSDFVTGFSIDTIHWQFLLVLMKNELCQRGQIILTNKLYYSLNSLHIYESDREVVKDWYAIDSYEHFLKTSLTLTQAIDNCKQYFKAGLSLEQLGDLLEFDDESKVAISALAEMFKTHRNVLVR